MKTLGYIAKDAMRRFTFVFCIQLIMLGLVIWISNLLSGPFSPPADERLHNTALMYSINLVFGFLAAFAINIYSALQIAKKFGLSFEDSALLVSKLQILYDKQMGELTAEYVYAELGKEKRSIELI